MRKSIPKLRGGRGKHVFLLIYDTLKNKGFLKMQKGLDLENHLIWSSIIVADKTKTV